MSASQGGSARVPLVDLWFPVVGARAPSDHGYLVYGALSRLVPALHGDGGPDWGLHTMRGVPTGDGYVTLDRDTRLGLRLAPENLPVVLKLAGARLELDDCAVRLGPPRVEAVEPAPDLSARIVTIRGCLEPGPFRDAVLRHLQTRGDAGGVQVEVGRRLVVQVALRSIVGFATRITGLSPEASRDVLLRGIGGRRRMGCGVFRRSLQPLGEDRRPGSASCPP